MGVRKYLKILVIIQIPVSAALVAGRLKSQEPDGRLPFELIRHIITVNGRINGLPDEYRFLVDTGGLTCLDNDLANTLRLKRRGPMVKMDTLEIAGFRIENIFCFTTFDFKPIDRAHGVTFQGMIGSDLLERFKVTLDYDQSVLILSHETSSNEVPANGFMLRFSNHPVNNAPMIKCRINGKHDIEAMIDSGQPYPLVLPLPFLDTFDLRRDETRIKALGSVAQWPGASSDDNYLARIQRLETGSWSTSNLAVLFAGLPRLLSVPLLGKDFLSQFLITINYPKDELVLIPRGRETGGGFDYSFGLSPVKNEAGGIVVRGVWIGSSAEQAGIRVGDEIIEVNAESVSGGFLPDLLRILSDPAVSRMELTLKTPKGLKTVQLDKKNLLKY